MAGRSWLDRIARTSLADVGSLALNGIYRRIGERARQEVLAELRRKGFDDIGSGELIATQSAIYDVGAHDSTQQLTGLYEVHLWIQRCVAMVAQSLPQAPLRFYRVTGFSEGREELEPWDDHPANKLFSYINPHMDPFTFWEWGLSFLNLTGMNYVAKVPASDSAPDGVEFDLYPLFPAFVRKVVTPQDGIVRYRYRVQGEDEIVLDASDVLYWHTFSPSDRFNGQGTMHAGRQSVLTDLRAQQFNDELLKNGVYMHGTLETEDDMDVSDAEALRDQFVKKYGGASNAAKVAVLYNGIQFKPHQIAHQDIQWLDQRKMSQEEIAIAHGIPLELLGIKAANYATLKEKRRIFWQDTIQSWGKRIESQMNSTSLPLLYPQTPDLRCQWDYSQIDALQSDILEVVKAGDIAIRSGQVTPDEWRQSQLSLPPLGGASELQYINGRPIEAVAASEAQRIIDAGSRGRGQAPSDDMPSDESQADEQLRLRSKAPSLARATQVRVVHGAEEKAAAQWRDKWDRVETRFENRMAVDWRKISREMEREVGQIVSRSHLGQIETMREVEHVFVTSGRSSAIDAADEIMRAGMKKWSDVVAAEAGIGNVWNLRNEVAEQYIKNRGSFLNDHFAKNGRKVSRIVGDGLRSGAPMPEIERELSRYFVSYRNQAQTIARTEVVASLNFSSSKAMEAAYTNGVNVRSRWVTMQDGHVRGQMVKDEFDHMAAEGLEIIPSKQLFIVSGESLEFPGDTKNGASPGNTINCRCTTQPIVKGVK